VVVAVLDVETIAAVVAVASNLHLL